jgi:hypothetical protein
MSSTTYRANGLGIGGRHDPVVAEELVDVERIVNDELARLAQLGPLDVRVAKAGPRGVDRRAREVLIEKGLTSFSAADYRAAVQKAIQELTSSEDRLDRAPATAGLLQDDLVVRAEAAMRRDGIVPSRADEKTTADYYCAAAAELEEPEEELPLGGEQLDEVAQAVLAQQGKDANSCTAAEYADALDEAAKLQARATEYVDAKQLVARGLR